MIWIKARFIEPKGVYVCTTIAFRTESLVEASNYLQMLASGYRLATGRKIGFDEVTTTNNSSDTTPYYIIPDHLERLEEFLLKYKDSGYLPFYNLTWTKLWRLFRLRLLSPRADKFKIAIVDYGYDD